MEEMERSPQLAIVQQGKKLDGDQTTDDGGEVTDEDEGAETNRTRSSRGGPVSRRLRICRELSDLIALNRGSSTKLPSSRDKSKFYQPIYPRTKLFRPISSVVSLRINRQLLKTSARVECQSTPIESRSRSLRFRCGVPRGCVLYPRART